MEVCNMILSFSIDASKVPLKIILPETNILVAPEN